MRCVTDRRVAALLSIGLGVLASGQSIVLAIRDPIADTPVATSYLLALLCGALVAGVHYASCRISEVLGGHPAWGVLGPLGWLISWLTRERYRRSASRRGARDDAIRPLDGGLGPESQQESR